MSTEEPPVTEPFADSSAPPEVRRIAAELLPTFYDQLKQMAQRARSRLGGNYTLQTTALVHEAFLRLRKSGGLHIHEQFVLVLNNGALQLGTRRSLTGKCLWEVSLIVIRLEIPWLAVLVVSEYSSSSLSVASSPRSVK